MFVHQSNRLEMLFEQFKAVINSPLQDPFAPETLVVQNPGMAQWLSQRLAFATGITANLQFPLPARFVWDLYHLLADTTGNETDLFTKQILLWRIAALLPRFAENPLFAEIAIYLHNDQDGCKCLQLAEKICDVFDQYMVYRPDFLRQWEQQQSAESWQALLWQELIKDNWPLRAHLRDQFQLLNIAQHADSGALPERIHFFGLNSLAPVFLEIINLISQHIEIHLFHLSPCRQYWGDLLSARRLADLRSKKQLPPAAEDLYFDRGNPLLISLGRAGQDFFQQLQEFDPQEYDLYREQEQDHLLAQLQNDFLDLRDRTVESARTSFSDNDFSIQFHVCASPLREIQVLHDRLLDYFQQIPDLSPGDILVTAPDIKRYTSAILGVFGEATRERRIPWTIADQTPAEESPLIRCFLDVLQLLIGRFTATEVLTLCEHEALIRRFALDSSLLPRLHQWVREAGICWGLDHEHRQDLHIWDARQHSWQYGLDRLLLGYLMGEEQTLFQELAPCTYFNIGEVEELGGFVDLIQQLRIWRRTFKEACPPEQWSQRLLAMVAALFNSDEEDPSLQLLQDTLYQIKTNCHLAGYETALSPAAIRQHLEQSFSGTGGGQAFLTGRVTFCNMVPMRSVPFQVIWMLGLNDQDFPRSQHPVSFDLIAQAPRQGDRNRRYDDRYLFLEAMLSARHILAISWNGHSLRDDSKRPPSVVVSELQDYLDQSFICEKEDQRPSEHLTTWHPMQPFSRRCFATNPSTASYNPAWMPSAEKISMPRFLPASLPASMLPEQYQVDLEAFVQFWRHPVRHFLHSCLGMNLKGNEAGVVESEPFSLDHLQQYRLRQQTISALLAGQSPEEIYTQCNAAGLLPQGGFGKGQFTLLMQDCAPYVQELTALLNDPLPPIEIELSLAPFHLTGWLNDLYACGRVTWRCAQIKGSTLMETWIRHLILNMIKPSGFMRRSIHLAKGSKTDQTASVRYTLEPVENPESHLQHLLCFYQQGQQTPLSFFPETSLIWARHEGTGQETAKALATWQGGFHHPGEGEDPAYDYFFSQEEPFSDFFIELTQVYRPLLDHLESDHATT